MSADMAASITTSDTTICWLLRHHRHHYRRNCQTTEQVLLRGFRRGICSFLWYDMQLEEVAPSVFDRLTWHSHSSRIPWYLTGYWRYLRWVWVPSREVLVSFLIKWTVELDTAKKKKNIIYSIRLIENGGS